MPKMHQNMFAVGANSHNEGPTSTGREGKREERNGEVEGEGRGKGKKNEEKGEGYQSTCHTVISSPVNSSHTRLITQSTRHSQGSTQQRHQMPDR